MQKNFDQSKYPDSESSIISLFLSVTLTLLSIKTTKKSLLVQNARKDSRVYLENNAFSFENTPLFSFSIAISGTDSPSIRRAILR